MKCNLKNFSYYTVAYFTLPYLYLFSFLLIAYSKNGLADLHARWLK
jgi:hypothetical protein